MQASLFHGVMIKSYRFIEIITTNNDQKTLCIMAGGK